MTAVPKWSLKGDWFDTCNCSIPCPCTFAQPPTSGDCEGILAWHIRDGSYGDVPLGGPTTLPGQRVQVHNPGGSEVGPNAIAPYGTSTADKAQAFDFKWDRVGRSSKHIRFNWSGPDAV